MTPMTLVEKLNLAKWLLAEDVLTGEQFKVAYVLLFQFHNSKNGDLFPSYSQQAEAANVSRPTAIRTVKILEGLGVLDVERTDGGRNRRNSYTLKMVSRADPLEGNGVTSGPLTVSPVDPHGVTSGPAYNQGSNQGRKDQEKNAASAASEVPSPACRQDPTEGERQLFERGKAVLGGNAGGFVARLLKAKGGNIALAMAAIETSSTKQNPREYVGAVISRGSAAPQDWKDKREDEAWAEARARARASERQLDV
jgi:hypothetical protein